MHYKILNFQDCDRYCKRAVCRFIKIFYPSVTYRDIISGLHKVGIDTTGTWKVVITDMSMVAKYSEVN